jgi:hypothetical protein
MSSRPVLQWLERSRPQLVPDGDDVRALDVLLAVEAAMDS